MRTKSALSWFGSDSDVQEEIAARFNHCSHVTIPFVAGAGIIAHLTARAIVANDLHSAAILFYRVISGRYGLQAKHDLIERCRTTLSHPAEMDVAIRFEGSECPIDKAWAMWAICWLGRKGKGGTKGRPGLPSVRRTAVGGTNASRIRSAADDLTAWAKHFERCEWESICFRELLPKCADDDSCGIYVDAPWISDGDNYLHSFSAADKGKADPLQSHRDLAGLLNRFEKTTVVVRYGDHPVIRQIYAEPRWRIVDASSRTQTNVVKGELLITNKD
jgi:DNA adenine methylase